MTRNDRIGAEPLVIRLSSTIRVSSAITHCGCRGVGKALSRRDSRRIILILPHHLAQEPAMSSSPTQTSWDSLTVVHPRLAQTIAAVNNARAPCCTFQTFAL